MPQIRINSNALMHSPGILKYYQAMYSTGKKKDKGLAVEFTNAVFFRGHDVEASEGLLTGKIPYTVEGEAILFDYEGDAYKIVEIKVSLRFDEPVSDEGSRQVAELLQAHTKHMLRQGDGSVYLGYSDGEASSPQNVTVEII